MCECCWVLFFLMPVDMRFQFYEYSRIPLIRLSLLSIRLVEKLRLYLFSLLFVLILALSNS